MKTVTILRPEAVSVIHMVAKKDFTGIIIEISIDLLKANNLGASYPHARVSGLEDGKRSRTLSLTSAPTQMSKSDSFQ